MHSPDLIRLLCGFRSEHYPYERAIGLLEFVSWLHFPRDPFLVEGARATAAATILSSTGSEKPRLELTGAQHRELAAATFQIAQVAPYLRTPPLFGGYSNHLRSYEHFCKQESLSEIVLFLLRCPSEEKGGINKAIDFIVTGGFAVDGEDIPSRPTLNRHWSSMAESSPFIVAADYIDYEWLLELSPNDPKSIDRANRFQTKHAKTYFGLAKKIQTEILSRLHVISKRNVESYFVDFPPELPPTKHKIATLEEDQLQIVKGYKERKRKAWEMQVDRSIAREDKRFRPE